VHKQQRERSTTVAAYEARKDPASLVGQRIDVPGKGEGVVTGLQKAAGKSTMHLIRFDATPTATPEAVLLQKETGGKGRMFYIVSETGTDVVSMRTGNVAKYAVGQYVQDMGATAVSGHVVTLVADAGSSGPGTLGIRPERGTKSAAELEDELAASKREHAKYTAARIATELEKAHAAHAAELQAERKRSAAEADELRAELAQLKKDE
jgi:hypothetical protein